MEDLSHLYNSQAGEDESLEEEEPGDKTQRESLSDHSYETNKLVTMTQDKKCKFLAYKLQDDSDRYPDLETQGSFSCQHCERHLTSKQGLERHVHIHAFTNRQTRNFKCKYCSKSFCSKIGQCRHEKRHQDTKLQPGSLVKPADSLGSASQSHLDTCPNISISVNRGHVSFLDQYKKNHKGHMCKYCKKVFSTHTNVQRHQRRIHKHHIRLKAVGKSSSLLEVNPKARPNSVSQKEPEPSHSTSLLAVKENEGEQQGQYMLDISNNISENLSFYIDGKLVSTSTVSSCQIVDFSLGSATPFEMDALIFHPSQLSQSLNAETATGREGQVLTKRRTTTPPLLPQIQTELESEAVGSSSSSSSFVSSLIESVLPQNTDHTIMQKERTVFLSPKLKQLLQTQDGLKPTLALVTDAQKICSPMSLTVQPLGTGRFKRRTGPPQQIPSSNTENITMDTEESDSLNAQKLDSKHSSPAHSVPSNEEDNCSLLSVEPMQESWPSVSGGSSCNQQPLDLSNAVRNEDIGQGEVVLDLSLQRKSPGDCETNVFVTQPLVKKRKPNTCMLEKVLMNVNPDITGELASNLLDTPEAPLLTDFTIVSASDIAASTEGLVFGLALPTSTLNSPPSTFDSIAIPPSSQCTMALGQTSHTVLPTAPSLFTVLAPSTSSMSSPSNQPAIQAFDPDLPSEPFVICTENTLNSTECDLSTALPEWASADSANLLTITQPIDPAINLPGHVILSEHGLNQIALNAPIVNPPVGSELPCYTSTLTLNDSLINSYNITSNTVLIECTLALDVPGNLVPTAIALQENTVASSEQTQMVINHLQQQQIISLPNPETLDPNIIVSSIAESVSLSTYSEALSDGETIVETNADTLFDTIKEEITPKEETADSGTNEMLVQASFTSKPAKAEESFHDAPNDKLPDTFTKNFMCNVCDKLFHSMKELGHHVSDHSDTWPYKCEFCLLLFGKPSALLDHRSTLHGVGKTFVCGACTKEFAYLCNLKHHQEELHPGQQCIYTEDEKGKLRPQNYNLSKGNPEDYSEPCSLIESKKVIKKEKAVENVTEELLTTIKIMGSDGRKLKASDVCFGINQHYPSYKPPPFPYHNRSPAGSVASATNFTTHNIPQTFSTAIRCTKCGKSFDNMPELHKHILTCANASDKRRYTPKKNPIPLRHFAKAQNGVLSSTNATNGQNSLQRASQSNKPKPNYGPPAKLRLNSLNKRKKKIVQRAMSQRSKAVSATNKAIPRVEEEGQEIFVCPLCNREFTYRRSRTKHMATCPMKPTKEVKKKKEGGISITKENNVILHTVGVISGEKRQASEQAQKPRAQSSSPAKRQAILPVQTVLGNKKSKTAIEESDHSNQETTKLNDSPINRTFNPSLRQYSKVQHGAKKTPIKITIVKPQQTQLQPKKNEPISDQPWNGAVRLAGSSLLQVGANVPVKDKQMNIQDPVRDKEKPIY